MGNGSGGDEIDIDNILVITTFYFYFSIDEVRSILFSINKNT